MKFSTILSTAASLASLANAAPAAATPTAASPAPSGTSQNFAKIVVEADDYHVNAKGLVGKHEGAGINYVFFSDEKRDLKYDPATNELAEDADYAPLRLSVYDGVATFSVIGDEATPILVGPDNYLAVNGSSDNFAACKNISDPYNYSENEYVLTYNTELPEGCLPLKLMVSSWSTIV